jgi:hypothetical protein
MLCRLQAMLQAAADDGLAFDPFAFEEDALGPSKIDVGGREIVEALVRSTATYDEPLSERSRGR